MRVRLLKLESEHLFESNWNSKIILSKTIPSLPLYKTVLLLEIGWLFLDSITMFFYIALPKLNYVIRQTYLTEIYLQWDWRSEAFPKVKSANQKRCFLMHLDKPQALRIE